MDTCFYMAESLCCSPEIIRHCQSAIPQYKIKFLKREKSHFTGQKVPCTRDLIHSELHY